MRHFAKKRDAFRAVQWFGELTPDVYDLVGDRGVVDLRVEAQQQLALGSGWYARLSDWICVTNEGLCVISDETFRKIYEEVDETGRAVPPTDAEHEVAGLAFVLKLDALLVTGLRLSSDQHPSIFRDRDMIVRELRRLLEDHAWVAARRERQQIKERLTKDFP
jgi:hypothetical protein